MQGAQQTQPTGFFNEGRPFAEPGAAGPAADEDAAAGGVVVVTAVVNSCSAPVEATGKSAALEAPCLPLPVVLCDKAFLSLVCSSVAACSITCTSISSVRRACTGWFALGGCRCGATDEFPPTADTRDVIASPVIDSSDRPRRKTPTPAMVAHQPPIRSRPLSFCQWLISHTMAHMAKVPENKITYTTAQRLIAFPFFPSPRVV